MKSVLRSSRKVAATLRRSASTRASTRFIAVTHPEDEASIPESVSSHLGKLTQNVLNTYARPPFIASRGKGSWLWDTQGRKYLDFSAGIAVNALGHSDPELARIMGEQAQTLLHTSNVFHNEWAGQLATLLVELTKREGGLGWEPESHTGSSKRNAKVFFTNSGTEANEGAFKFARKIATERWKQEFQGASPDARKTRFVCFEGAFHGRSMGALSATTNPKYQDPFKPLVPGFDVGTLNNIEQVEKLIGESTCGVIIETIQGEGGVNAASEEFLRAIRRKCDEVGAVLIFDEIQCGLYRTGDLWAHSKLPVDCHPDIVTMAKPLANGYPIGAIMVRDQFSEAITVGSHGTTFGGSPLGTRLGHHVLSRLSQPSFVSHVQDVSGHLHERVSALSSLFPNLIGPTIRGRGLILGIPFANHEHPARLVKLARERGVLLLTAGKDAVRLVPSLNVEKKEVDFAVDVIESSLGLLS